MFIVWVSLIPGFDVSLKIRQMQPKKTLNIKKMLAELALCLNANNNGILADKLGLPRTTVYAWVKNGRIGDTGAILAKCPGININWLNTGQGPMFLNALHPNAPLLSHADTEPLNNKENDEMKDEMIKFLMEQIRQKDARIRMLEEKHAYRQEDPVKKTG